jgi:DNA-binding transcriptional LysR family regulator
VLDLHRLRLLRELKHRGTLAAVAEALAYTPSAISQQLSVLEAEAGVPLLERTGRRVRLTPAAERLVEHTEAILERLEQARADLDASAASIGGTVRIAAFHTTAHTVIPVALSALARAHPALRAEVTEREPESSLPGLIAHEFDLALIEEYPGHPQFRRPELDYRQLATDPMRLAQPASASPRALADLAGHSWILEPPGTAARHWATAVCRAAGFEPDVRYQSTDLLLHLRLVRTGHAVALLPALLSAAPPGPAPTRTDPAIHLSDLPGSPARRIYAATRRGASQQPALAAVRAALATAIQASSAP